MARSQSSLTGNIQLHSGGTLRAKWLRSQARTAWLQAPGTILLLRAALEPLEEPWSLK